MQLFYLLADAASSGGVAQSNWLVDLFTRTDGPTSVAHSVLVIMLVSAVGLALGDVKVRGVGLGIAWVLFAGLAVGGFGMSIDGHVLHFVREFGLILFVFTIGMQVGPAFFASLRRQGLGLNLAAGMVVLGGVLVTLLQWWWLTGGDRSRLPEMVGLLSGATTNTPSLAAGQAAIVDVGGSGAAMGSAYAVAYPGGVMGVLIVMLVLKSIFRIDTANEQRKLVESEHRHPALDVRNLEVVNPSLDGRRLGDVPTLGAGGVVVTRHLRAGSVEMAGPEAVLRLGDVLTAVGPSAGLDDLQLIIGRAAEVDARSVRSEVDVRRVLVSRREAVGRSLDELGLRERFNVQLTRIQRAGFELPVTPQSRLQFGDRVMVVGEKESLPAAADALGDSRHALDRPMLIPILLGIALGVIVGSIPIPVGLPMPLKLGLAGGPLIVAIVLSRIYRIGPLVWYMSPSSNYFLRELGIVMFLACVGLSSGSGFIETLKTSGLSWIGMAIAITVVPVLGVGLVLRAIFKLNFNTILGVLSGSMTDPPALAFAQSMARSEAPMVSYAAVYPLTMLLRVLSVQVIVIWLAG
jgi:putative transport protein